MSWDEVRLKEGHKPLEFYDWLGQRDGNFHAHHFWDEPWWPGAYVVRVADAEDLDDCPAVAHVVPWDSGPDEALYGKHWEWTRFFFEASSVLASCGPDRGMNEKFVHCFLNAQGMSQRDEARFAARFLWNRLTITLRWRLYLRRRWQKIEKAAT